jgi:hypothetical protein
VAKGDIILCICGQLDIKLSIVEYNMSLLFSDSLPRGSYVDDRNNPPIISATYLLFTAPQSNSDCLTSGLKLIVPSSLRCSFLKWV